MRATDRLNRLNLAGDCSGSPGNFKPAAPAEAEALTRWTASCGDKPEGDVPGVAIPLLFTREKCSGVNCPRTEYSPNTRGTGLTDCGCGTTFATVHGKACSLEFYRSIPRLIVRCLTSLFDSPILFGVRREVCNGGTIYFSVLYPLYLGRVGLSPPSSQW